MNKTDCKEINKALKDFNGDFAEELDIELNKIITLKDKLLYLYKLKRENENHNVLAGGFYYYGMVILSRLNYYDTALQYNKRHNQDLKNTLKKTDENSKIIWKKSKEDLTALIDKLIDLGFIGYEKDKKALIAEHFGWVSEISAPKRRSDNNSYKIIRNNSNNINNTGIKTFLETFEKKNKS